jgi:hypothetical protein
MLGEAVHDPERHFATVICRIAKGSLYHLVGGHLHNLRYGKAERFGCLEVDDEIELSRLQHRQISRLLALDDAAGKGSGLAIHVEDIGAVGHEAAVHDFEAHLVYRRNCVVGGKSGRALKPSGDCRIVANEHGANLAFLERGKSGVEFTLRRRVNHVRFEPDVTNRFSAPAIRLFGIEEEADCHRLRHHRVQQLDPLWHQRRKENVDPGRVAAGVVETGDESGRNRIYAGRKHDRDRPRRSLRRLRRKIAAVRLQLHALAYNLGNFLRTLATPEPIKDWSLTSLKEKLIKIGAKVVSHGRYVAFQMAEVAIPRQMFQEILRLIAELRPQPPPAPA